MIVPPDDALEGRLVERELVYDLLLTNVDCQECCTLHRRLLNSNQYKTWLATHHDGDAVVTHSVVGSALQNIY